MAKLDPKQRPACAFEVEEYETTLSTILDQLGIRMEDPADGAPVELSRDSDGEEILSHTQAPAIPNGYAFARMMAGFAAESFALTKVMMQRAAAHLDEREVTAVRAPRPAKEPSNPHQTLPPRTESRPKPSSATPHAVQAFVRLNREHRQWHKVLIDTAKELFAGQGKTLYTWNTSIQDAHIGDYGGMSNPSSVEERAAARREMAERIDERLRGSANSEGMRRGNGKEPHPVPG